MKNKSKFLRADQKELLELENPSQNTKKWSNATIREAIKIRLVCRSRGYEALRLNHHFPLPSLVTVNRRLRGLELIPGEYENTAVQLGKKVRRLSDDMKHAGLCVMEVDEMSTSPCIEYDKGLGGFLGFVSPQTARDEPQKLEKATYYFCLASWFVLPLEAASYVRLDGEEYLCEEDVEFLKRNNSETVEGEDFCHCHFFRHGPPQSSFVDSGWYHHRQDHVAAVCSPWSRKTEWTETRPRF